jgi:hypothetical protein
MQTIPRIRELLAGALGRRRASRARPALRWISRPMRARVDLSDKDALYAVLGGERRS